VDDVTVVEFVEPLEHFISHLPYAFLLDSHSRVQMLLDFTLL
jgi:hypothetical protein